MAFISRFLIFALLLLPQQTMASEEGWKQEVKYLYLDLMQLIGTEGFKEYGYSEAGPAAEWLSRYKDIDERSPDGFPLRLSNDPEDVVTVGDLWQLGREFVSLSPDPEYIARKSTQWAEVVFCIDYPEACKENQKYKLSPDQVIQLYNDDLEQRGFDNPDRYRIPDLKVPENALFPDRSLEYKFNNLVGLDVSTNDDGTVKMVTVMTQGGDNIPNISLGLQVSNILFTALSPELGNKRGAFFFDYTIKEINEKASSEMRAIEGKNLIYTIEYANNFGLFFKGYFK